MTVIGTGNAATFCNSLTMTLTGSSEMVLIDDLNRNKGYYDWVDADVTNVYKLTDGYKVILT